MSISSLTSYQRHSLNLVQQFRRKAMLPLLPDRVWRIEQGLVRSLTWNEQGQVMTLGLWLPGDIVGLPLTQLRPFQLECLSAVVITEQCPRDRSYPEALLKHLWRSEEFFTLVHQPCLSMRLMQLLYWLGQRIGQPRPAGQLIEPCLTHQQLAEALGTSRVTVTRLLKQLEQAGQLQRPQHRGRKTAPSPILLPWATMDGPSAGRCSRASR